MSVAMFYCCFGYCSGFKWGTSCLNEDISSVEKGKGISDHLSDNHFHLRGGSKAPSQADRFTEARFIHYKFPWFSLCFSPIT